MDAITAKMLLKMENILDAGAKVEVQEILHISKTNSYIMFSWIWGRNIYYYWSIYSLPMHQIVRTNTRHIIEKAWYRKYFRE